MEGSSAETPLMSHQEDVEPDTLDAPEPAGRIIHDGGIGIFMWLLTLCAGISGLLFGCKPYL